VEAILVVVVWGFVVGSLARFAVPGPDPMPWWLTITFGVGGSAVALLIAATLLGEPTTAEQASEFALMVFVASVMTTAVAIIVYRRLVQDRGITGPEAQRMPERGIGVESERERLGVEESDPAARLRKLAELRDEGLISEEEYEERRSAVLERL
jgi:uncharacterized membrane protein YeaQ/YmgE (transglycosylase-associated protein family)